MSGIHVLSDTLKVGSKLEKSQTPKGKDASDSPGNAAAAFAAMLSGSMNQRVDPKGQNSKAGQDLEEKQSAGDPMQSAQNPNGQGIMLGYGNFALPFLTQMLQSDLPAGKEANSGNGVSQGTVGLATANTSLTSVPVISGNNLVLALLNLVSQASNEISAQSGMTTPNPQGGNPAITELDKYRQVIADLLVELSGEITDKSPKGTSIGPVSGGTKDISKAGQDLEEKQSAGDPMQSAQNPNGQGIMLGYGNFALPFLTQMLQSDLPAGKEANSGNGVSQGTVGLATANTSLTSVPVISGNNLVLALLNLVSQASNEISAQSGMTTPNPQGDNPAITELDKYRQVIADILDELSGEITDKSPKGTSIGPVSGGTKDISQEIAKIVQGWMSVTDDVDKNGSISTNQKGIQPLLDVLTAGIRSGDPVLNAKVSTLLAALNPLLSQEVKDAKTPQSVNGTTDTENGIIDSVAKGSSESFQKQLVGTDLNPVATQAKDIALLTNAQKKEGMSTLKGDSTQSTELSGGKDVHNQNSSLGIGLANNIVATNVTDGKTVAVPVWEQISTLISEQVMNGSQDLKQLNIQLHPADLGKIQIDLRWEDGQVHLQVQASQAATGQLLQNHLSDLRQTLTSQGVNCGMLQMGQGGERQQNPQGDASQRTSNQNSDFNEDEELIPVFPTTLSLGQDEINRINVTA